MRVVHDLLTAIALSERYPVGFVGPVTHLRCFRTCCTEKITIYEGDTITLLYSWRDYCQLLTSDPSFFICICGKAMLGH